ncbi:DUF2381 family protein [Vitiosangium sp. GDMCC 1.1324]|uniref:DUF2381 family protein n=1 Tax=Vitiosangium sp. (strain GDMCC 1.1324) TaxID=2138576 RepID=UPI000D3C317D|nr:DUF2381 family protein [Vitiosangium sp. GDMCC 1.1324]PTL85294.1 hypothetical protein DAT35_00795 [Vitiosangium sp. GDMCC 1.1324]
MPLASPVGLLALALLATPPKAPEPSRPDECETASPRLELTAEPPARQPVVCGSPRMSTTFRFDSLLLPESVRIQERERFEDVAVGRTTLTLVSPKNMVAGERFTVEVCFVDGAAPACASFLLVGHPGLGMQQVEVFRQPRPVASYQQAEREARAEAQQLREEVRQLRAELGAPEGLRGVFASGLLGKQGIACKDLTDRFIQPEGNALSPEDVRSCRAEGRVAVEVWLLNPGAVPWTAGGAVLRGPKGEVLKPLPLWQPEPILPSEPGVITKRQGRVVVEVLASATEARGTYTLTLWDAEHKRTVILGNVTFP